MFLLPGDGPMRSTVVCLSPPDVVLPFAALMTKQQPEDPAVMADGPQGQREEEGG